MKITLARHFFTHSSSNPKAPATSVRGITLIELLSTLTIMSIVTAMGMPAMDQWIQRKTEDTVLKSLFHLSVYTRTEAIKASDYFTFCPTEDKISCGGNWNKEIMVFKDSNKNEAIDEDDVLFKLIRLPATSPCIEWILKKRQYVQFKPSGASNGTAGHFKFCNQDKSLIDKKVIISFNGRTSMRAL
jgi:type IV fimbrial biogenesis protein FimT